MTMGVSRMARYKHISYSKIVNYLSCISFSLKSDETRRLNTKHWWCPFIFTQEYFQCAQDIIYYRLFTTHFKWPRRVPSSLTSIFQVRGRTLNLNRVHHSLLWSIAWTRPCMQTVRLSKQLKIKKAFGWSPYIDSTDHVDICAFWWKYRQTHFIWQRGRTGFSLNNLDIVFMRQCGHWSFELDNVERDEFFRWTTCRPICRLGLTGKGAIDTEAHARTGEMKVSSWRSSFSGGRQMVQH